MGLLEIFDGCLSEILFVIWRYLVGVLEIFGVCWRYLFDVLEISIRCPECI